MGFFQDLKEDLSMAVNELIPEENLDNQPNEDVSAAISEQEAINADAFRAAVERLDDEFPTVEIPEEAAQMMAAAQEAEIPQMEAVPEEAMPKLPEMQELPAMEEPEPAADPAMQELWNQVPTEEEGVSLDELVAVAEAAAVSAGEEIPFAKQAEAPVMPEAPVQAA
nr:hypothetical protein [Lachnospiraceae bacterium]